MFFSSLFWGLKLEMLQFVCHVIKPFAFLFSVPEMEYLFPCFQKTAAFRGFSHSNFSDGSIILVSHLEL